MSPPRVWTMREIESNPAVFFLKATPFGSVAVIWSVRRHEPKAIRILLSRPGVSAEKAVKSFTPRARLSSCSEIEALASRIHAFLSGEDVPFSLGAVRLDLCSSFQQNVLRSEHAIPRGSVSTYHLIAKHLGMAKGARAVGTALAHNPFPIVIPCHRAVRSDRCMGGYQGGIDMKRALLENEGVPFDDAGRVVCERFYYDGNHLDA